MFKLDNLSIIVGRAAKANKRENLVFEDVPLAHQTWHDFRGCESREVILGGFGRYPEGKHFDFCLMMPWDAGAGGGGCA